MAVRREAPARQILTEEAESEAYVSTEQAETGEEAWLPRPDAHRSGACHRSGSSEAGTDASHGLIGRVRDRETFEAFRRRGRRGRRGPVTVVYLPDSGPGVRVAFGVGRGVGSAVARNKVRRRLRQIMRDMTRGAQHLPAGAYLLITRPEVAELPYSDLARAVAAACEEATR